MRGHIVKRSKNGYSIVIELGADPVTGKRRQQWISLNGTKKEAEKKLAAVPLALGRVMTPSKNICGGIRCRRKLASN